MELRRIIPTDITASAIVHVSLLTLVLLFSEVHPFGGDRRADPGRDRDPARACREASASRRAACRKQAGTGANAAARFLAAGQAGGRQSAPANGTAGACRAAAAGCARHAARGSAAASRVAVTTSGGIGLQAARAGYLDQVSGAAGLAAGPLASAVARSRARP